MSGGSKPVILGAEGLCSGSPALLVLGSSLSHCSHPAPLCCGLLLGLASWSPHTLEFFPSLFLTSNLKVSPIACPANLRNEFRE